MGVLTRADVTKLDVTFATSGFGVIVTRGVRSAAGILRAREAIRTHRPHAEEIAPRTVLAVDQSNRLVMVAIDGVEKLKLGLTMDELAEVFSGGADGFPLTNDVQTAVNMDGGGSTTFSASPILFAVIPAQIYNRPTDTDTGPVSERAVTSIVCVR